MAQHHDKLGSYRRPSLQFNALQRPDEEPTITSPKSSATIQTPDIELKTASTSLDAEGLDLDGEKRESLIGPQRSSGVKADKEKRKRSRVTPEQLVHLERYFAMDRSPTATRRKDISDHLGMHERQTQIWFQNRRAKAKLHETKHQRLDSAEYIQDQPPELSPGYEGDLLSLIHEDEPVTIIPCTDLTVGSWRRIASSASRYDLVAYISEVKRCLTWFIQSAGYGFKMEIPFQTIVDTEFSQTSPGSGMAVFVLSQPPVFYLENISSPRADGSVVRAWKRCSDWTEGLQATTVLRHTLIGSADQLARVLQSLHASGSPIVVATLPMAAAAPAPYRPEPQNASPMALPSSPLASISGAATASYPPFSNVGMKPHHLARIDTRQHKRPSLSFDALETQYPINADQRSAPPHSAPSSTFPSQPFMVPVARPLPPHSAFEASSAYPFRRHSHQATMPSHPQEVVELQHHSLNYPAPPYREHDPRALQAFPLEGQQVVAAPEFSRPLMSPTLLMSPYEPQPNRRPSYIPNPPSPHVLAGMPAIAYDVDLEQQQQQQHHQHHP